MLQNLAAVIFIWLPALFLYAHTIPALPNLGAALLSSVGVLSIIVGSAAQTER